MAVLDGLPGVEVAVVADGEDLHEYQDADMEDDEDTVTKYIEAVDNTNFAIKIKVTKDAKFKGRALSFRMSVDGSSVRNALVRSTLVRARTHVRVVEGAQVKAQRMRKLKFNALETVTEHGFGLSQDIERVKDMGKIEVRVCHVNMIKKIQTKYRNPHSGNGSFISEKALKGQGMTHSYSLDEETDHADSTFWDTKTVIGVKDPAAVFVFHYRSKASLKNSMIIPRTPSPVPLEDRPEEELTPEEMAQLVRQLKAKVANTAAIKRERADDNDNNSHAPKKARSSASADPVHLELNDDDTFTEVTVAPKGKTIIALDD
ncbi:hypothetical protein KCU77_g9196, partial [Aureobasidium melanogenum]